VLFFCLELLISSINNRNWNKKMAIVKRTNSNLLITTTSIPGNVTLDTDDVIVTGNLTVLGTQTTLSSVDTEIKDNIITLNSGQAGDEGVVLPLGTPFSGIVIDRGNLSPAVFGWDETNDKWVISSDGITFANIASFVGNVSITAVADDTNPTLGGNLNTLSYEIFSSTTNVIVNDTLQLNTQATPANVASSSILYANTIGGGTTGLYVVNDRIASGEELVTKTRAFGFSLIL
jgi:hypothetical protein